MLLLASWVAAAVLEGATVSGSPFLSLGTPFSTIARNSVIRTVRGPLVIYLSNLCPGNTTTWSFGGVVQVVTRLGEIV